MKRFFKLLGPIIAISVVAVLAAGCCCPISLPTSGNAQKLADDAAKRVEATNKAMQEAEIPGLETLATGETDLIKNGDFSDGLTGWTTRTQPGSKVAGNNSVDLKGSSAKYLEFKRVNGGTDGGGAFASQNINKDVSGYTSLLVKLGVNVISEEGGNIANTNPQWFPEGACQVRVFYVAADGTSKEWYHGFYSENVSGADASHFDRVTAGTWTQNTSVNLMASVPAPKTITKIEIYGFGWNFDGYLTAVQMIAN